MSTHDEMAPSAARASDAARLPWSHVDISHVWTAMWAVVWMVVWRVSNVGVLTGK